MTSRTAPGFSLLIRDGRRVNDQAAGLADELAQSQHQAELEQQHAQDLQSEAISGKLHLMQEVEGLKQELQQATQNAASTALQVQHAMLLNKGGQPLRCVRVKPADDITSKMHVLRNLRTALPRSCCPCRLSHHMLHTGTITAAAAAARTRGAFPAHVHQQPCPS